MMSVFRSLSPCFCFEGVLLCLDQSLVTDVCSTHDNGSSSCSDQQTLCCSWGKLAGLRHIHLGQKTTTQIGCCYFCHCFSGYGTDISHLHSFCCPPSSVCLVFFSPGETLHLTENVGCYSEVWKTGLQHFRVSASSAVAWHFWPCTSSRNEAWGSSFSSWISFDHWRSRSLRSSKTKQINTQFAGGWKFKANT